MRIDSRFADKDPTSTLLLMPKSQKLKHLFLLSLAWSVLASVGGNLYLYTDLWDYGDDTYCNSKLFSRLVSLYVTLLPSLSFLKIFLPVSILILEGSMLTFIAPSKFLSLWLSNLKSLFYTKHNFYLIGGGIFLLPVSTFRFLLLPSWPFPWELACCKVF